MSRQPNNDTQHAQSLAGGSLTREGNQTTLTVVVVVVVEIVVDEVVGEIAGVELDFDSTGVVNRERSCFLRV
jgi:hypothetical protein